MYEVFFGPLPVVALIFIMMGMIILISRGG